MRYFIDLAVYNKLDLHAFWQMEFDRDVSILPLKDAELRCGKTIESREGSCVPYGHTNSVHAANK